MASIGWSYLTDAPVNVVGQVWCREMEERAECLGTVRENLDGDRFIESPWSGYEFTHWHPIARPPQREQSLEDAMHLAAVCMSYPEGRDGDAIQRLLSRVLWEEGVWGRGEHAEAMNLQRPYFLNNRDHRRAQS